MLDASSKTPSGLLSYNTGDMGYFEQCISTKSKYDNIKAKYCLGYISLKSVNHSRSVDLFSWNEEVKQS